MNQRLFILAFEGIYYVEAALSPPVEQLHAQVLRPFHQCLLTTQKIKQQGYVKYYLQKCVVFYNLSLQFGGLVFVSFVNRISEIISNYHWGTRKQPLGETCNVSEAAHQRLGFLLMFYPSASPAHQKTIKNACTTHRGSSLESAGCKVLKQTVYFVSSWLVGDGMLFPPGTSLYPFSKTQVK